MQSTELPGRLIVDSNQRPELGSLVVIELPHGWYHGSLVELGVSTLVGESYHFIRCRAAVQDPMYPATEPQDPPGNYVCREWDRAMWATTRELTRRIREGRSTLEMMERAKEFGVEYITGVAIRQDGRVYQLGWPARHHTILHMLNQTIGLSEHDQGFLTSLGRYVDRQEAAGLARAAGQTVSQRQQLFSEDLW